MHRCGPDIGSTVVADGLDRALVDGVAAGLLFVIVRGLLRDESVTFVLIALEIVRSRLAAQVTIDTVAIDVECQPSFPPALFVPVDRGDPNRTGVFNFLTT